MEAECSSEHICNTTHYFHWVGLSAGLDVVINRKFLQNIPSHHETESQDGSQCGYARSIQQHYTEDSSLAPRTNLLTAPF